MSEIGFKLDREQYLSDMTAGLGTWAQIRAAGADDGVIASLRAARNTYYQEFLSTKPIAIDGVLEALEELSRIASMGIVTTSKRADFNLIHKHGEITKYMDFVLVREDYSCPKPHPEPYLEGLRRLRADREDTLVVEDSSRGLQSAVAAGIDCVVVYNAFTCTQNFSKAAARIERLTDLKDLALNWP